MMGGFRIVCMNCNKAGGEIAGAEVDGKPYIAIRCPHCERMIAKPADGIEWKEIAKVS